MPPKRSPSRAERVRRFKFAQLIEHFGLTPPQIGELTEATIAALYEHPRDSKTGALIAPSAPAQDTEPRTLEEALRQLEMINAQFPQPAEQYAELRERLKVRWAQVEADKALAREARRRKSWEV